MIAGLSRFSEAEILHVYQATCLPGFPCPTRLFAQVQAITALRVAAASGSDVREAAAAVWEGIEAFDAAGWKESSYELPDSPLIILLARIFKLAVGLYCTSALRVPGQNRRDEGRRCVELMALLDEAWLDARCEAHVGWPLAVAGFAVGRLCVEDEDGVGIRAGDKAKTRRYLGALATRHHRTGSGIALEKLEVFWASGGTEWDRCWDEPFIETD